LPSHAFDGISGGILAADGMHLSDKAIRALKPKEQASKATGGHGLHMLATICAYGDSIIAGSGAQDEDAPPSCRAA
jgi:hypothetical protein